MGTFKVKPPIFFGVKYPFQLSLLERFFLLPLASPKNPSLLSLCHILLGTQAHITPLFTTTHATLFCQCSSSSSALLINLLYSFFIVINPFFRLSFTLDSSFTSPTSFPSSDSLRALQQNAVGIRSRSVKLIYFLLLFPVDLICIQEPNLNSPSFRIPGYSSLSSDGTHSHSGFASTNNTQAGGVVVIFVTQGLSFSKLSTSSLSLLDQFTNYAH